MPDTPILTNPLKEMMKAGKVALGMNVRLARSGDIARRLRTEAGRRRELCGAPSGGFVVHGVLLWNVTG